MSLSSDQRAGLWRAKLRGLARDNLSRPDGADHAAPWGAALDSGGAWTALVEQAPLRSFGQALVLALGNGADSLDLLVGEQAGAVARRASLFEPEPTVWEIDGAQLRRAEPTPAALPPEAAELEPHIATLLALDDVTVVTEHGSIIGECLGLEVARVTGAGEQQRLDVGVGAYDQGAFAAINPDMTPNESLAEVVAQVLLHRRSDALIHPLNRLARERWVRSVLLDDPSLVGLDDLQIVEPMRPRDGVKDVTVASGVGTRSDGAAVLVACTVGIDLDAVPAAVDLAELHDTDSILVVLPDRDRHPLVQSLAERSRRPVDFVTAPEPWAGTG